MTTRTRLDAELATRRYTRRHAREIVTAVLGNNSGTVVATADTRWYWIRLHGDPNQVVRAWNAGFVPPVNNLPVDIEIVKGTGITDYQIIGVSINKGVAADVYAGAIGMHALQHQRRDFNTGGFDPLDIYARAIVQLRARAQTVPNMTLYVEAGWFSVAGIATYFAGGNSAAFTAPGFGFRCDLLYLDSAGALQIVTGTTIPFGTPVRPTQPTATDLPLAYVYLTAATTSITEYIIEDARVVFGGGGGSTGTDIDAAAADTPLNADEFGFWDVVDAILKKITWANIKATLKTYFDGFYVTGPAGATDGDVALFDGATGRLIKDGGAPVDIGSDAADIDAVNFNEQGADPAAPGAGHWLLFLKSDGLYEEDDGGLVTKVGGGHAIEDEGIAVTQRATLNFTGPGVAVTDSGGAKTKVQISRWEPLTADTIAFDDMRVPGAMVRLGATAPALNAFGPSGSLKVLFFEEGHHDEIHFEIQMPHSWKEGTKVYPHVHWAPVTTEAGNVVWQLEYAWQDIAGTFGAPGNLTSDATAAGGTAWVHHMTYLKDGSGNNYIDGAGKTISSVVVCRLHRNAGAGSDTLTEAVAFLEFDMHYQLDSLGSDAEGSKSTDTRAELVYADGDTIMCEVVT